MFCKSMIIFFHELLIKIMLKHFCYIKTNDIMGKNDDIVLSIYLSTSNAHTLYIVQWISITLN